MLKKFRSKEFLMGIVFTLVLVSAVNVFASGPIKKQIDVVYNNIKLVVDGKPVSFGKDSAGNRIEPLIHNGTTYLPIRSVGEAIGKRVDWDGTTQTVYLGEKPGEISFMTETIEPYSHSVVKKYTLNSPTKLNMGGVEYDTGYKIGGSRWPSDRYNYMYFNLDSKYSEINGYLGAFGGDDLKLHIYLDDNLYKSITVKGNTIPSELSIPVKGVNQIGFRAEAFYNAIGLGDLTLK